MEGWCGDCKGNWYHGLEELPSLQVCKEELVGICNTQWHGDFCLLNVFITDYCKLLLVKQVDIRSYNKLPPVKQLYLWLITYMCAYIYIYSIQRITSAALTKPLPGVKLITSGWSLASKVIQTQTLQTARWGCSPQPGSGLHKRSLWAGKFTQGKISERSSILGGNRVIFFILDT